jgi:hypothetical protein
MDDEENRGCALGEVSSPLGMAEVALCPGLSRAQSCQEPLTPRSVIGSEHEGADRGEATVDTALRREQPVNTKRARQRSGLCLQCVRFFLPALRIQLGNRPLEGLRL